MRQKTFSSLGFEIHGKQTRRQRFLAEMDKIVPWGKLCRLIEPHYPQGHRGRPPIGVERMLRIYFLQVWFNLSDPGAEDALYDSAAMRGFVDIDLGREPAPDETTICKFRHLIEANGLGKTLFEAVNAHLSAKGIKVGTGSIMDATIIAAPSSTKNEVSKNRTKSRVRAYVEHPFRILKCVFGFRKVCYRGIAKNLNRLQISFALVNLYMKRRTLIRYAMA